MNPRHWLLLLVSLLACVSPLRAQDFWSKSHLEPSLVADTTAIVPGKPFTAGVLMKMDPGWHTYWQFPGDSGGAPKIEWQLPEGFKAGEIQWPFPKAHLDEGDMLTYVYDDEVMFLVEITPPAQLPPGEVKLSAQVQWLVCEKTCIPGQGPVSLTLPVANDATAANADLFKTWRAQLPKDTPPPFSAKWDMADPKALSVTVSGLKPDEKLEFFPLPPQGATPEHPKISAPAADGTRTITVPFTVEGGLAGPWRGLFVTQRDASPREGWIITAQASSTTRQSAAASGSEVSAVSPSRGQKQGLLGVLGIAFLGGLILNVMPCVLPVIALKIFGFMNQAHESRERIFRLGLAFVAGVYVFFLGLAVAVVALKAAGGGLNWGFQFQNPFILAGLIALVFVFSLNMLGVFEVTLGSGTTSKLSELSSKEGYGGAFLHGLFTTLLGTSCTAPFLAPSLGYATLQPAPVVFVLFLAIATGMSLPYFLLTAQPAWLRYVPKPGMWMERVKQILGFIVLGVAVWLLTVLTSTHGAEAGGAVTWYLLALGVACWALGAFRQRALMWTVLLVVAIGGFALFLREPLSATEGIAEKKSAPVENGGIAWEPWSPEAVTSAVQSGRPVFVDFTADWCINCKFFERTVLATEPIRTALREKNVITLKADYTKTDPAIKAELARFSRVGVPLYVLYRPGEADPVVMDGLTKGGLLSELSAIKPAATAVASASN
ncbi:protein-disulfide reductase DsbD family protein [Verrucomicrobiota bacterium sgz303538]